MKQNAEPAPLTPKQLKVAELLANPDADLTKTDIIENTGVSRATFYRWLKQPEFIDHVNELIEKYTDGELAAVWKALIKKCEGGNVAAIKLYFELKGKYKQNIQVEAPPISGKLAAVFEQLGGEGLGDDD